MNRRIIDLQLITPVFILGMFLRTFSPGCSTTTEQFISWRVDFDQVLIDGRQSGKPILTYLYTDSCTYCKEMEATTFQDPLLFKEMGEDYLWVKLNAETDPIGSKLREKFSVFSYPVILLTDYDGSEIDRLSGYITASKFKQRIEGFLEGEDTFKGLQERLKKDGGSLLTHFSLAKKYIERSQFFPAAKHLIRVIVEDPENLKDKTDKSYYLLANTLVSGGHPDEALNQLESLYNHFPDSPILPEALILESQIHAFNKRPQQARKVLENFLEKFPQHTNRAWAKQLIKELNPVPLSMAQSH